MFDWCRSLFGAIKYVYILHFSSLFDNCFFTMRLIRGLDASINISVFGNRHIRDQFNLAYH